MMRSRTGQQHVRGQGTALAVVVAAWASSVAWVASPWPAAPAAQQSPAMPPAGAAPVSEPPEAFRRVCIKCHTSDRVVQGRRFRPQWEELIEQMVSRGAVVNDEDFEVIIGYLVSEFGRVRVNTATAPELASVLHLEAAEADAIVTARRAAGRFADFDALVAAPGVPVAALTTRRDALFF
ncbi:Helix-hairpin-helix motif [Luteitalea pratensis]|uniref:Helix-hairpin-helix motif n=1 Tax=Luteitalea pratensis TaxID=1855912 RepID=A0A143PUP2_LUTPR|nr:helix-hairpin-helix domain-containing protein [Luteitalea pratensis]AMY11519.1 Helix-hairpin-helix motif [Luteitalea pratensis]